jgi:hypothetical protein
MNSTRKSKQDEIIDNDHQKAVSGQKQRGPTAKIGKGAGGNAGSERQNFRAGASDSATARSGSIGSHKPGGDGIGTKKFKHEHDQRGRGRAK